MLVCREAGLAVMFLVEWLTFEVHGIHEHKHHVMRNTFQEVGNVTVGDVLHPLVDLFHRDQRDWP